MACRRLSADDYDKNGITTPDDAKPENNPAQAVGEHVVKSAFLHALPGTMVLPFLIRQAELFADLIKGPGEVFRPGAAGQPKSIEELIPMAANIAMASELGRATPFKAPTTKPLVEGQPEAAAPIDLAEAKRLRAIGDESPPPTNEPPAEAAKRAMAADAKPDEKITLEPQDEWMDRVRKTVSKIDKPDDARRIILDAVPNIDVDAIRSGELPVRDVQELASAAGLKPGELDPATMSRKFRNDDTVRGVITAALQATDEVKAAASAVDLAPTPENLIKMQQAIDRHALLVEQWFGHRAEWGRTGNVFQEFMTEAGEARSINDMLKDRDTNPTDLKVLCPRDQGYG